MLHYFQNCFQVIFTKLTGTDRWYTQIATYRHRCRYREIEIIVTIWKRYGWLIPPCNQHTFGSHPLHARHWACFWGNSLRKHTRGCLVNKTDKSPSLLELLCWHSGRKYINSNYTKDCLVHIQMPTPYYNAKHMMSNQWTGIIFSYNPLFSLVVRIMCNYMSEHTEGCLERMRPDG